MPIRIIVGYIMTVVLGLVARMLLNIASKRKKVLSCQREEVDF